MRKINALTILFLFSGMSMLFAIPSAPGTNGGMVVKKETRTVGSFTGVKIGGAFEVYIKQTGTPSVIIEADEEILPNIATEVEGGILRIWMKKSAPKCWDNARTLKVYLTVADFTSLEVSGAVEVKTESVIRSEQLAIEASGAVEADLNLEVAKLALELSGACDIEITGTGKNVAVEASGASELDAFGFEVQDLVIMASGANDARVNVSGSLKVSASGACDVKYKGRASVNIHTSGASSVIKVD